MDKLCYSVEPNLLFGRPGPATTHWNLAHFKAQGLHAILSLVTTDSGAQIKEAGLVHYSLPFQDKMTTPYTSSNNSLFPILREFDIILDRHLASNEPILVHCNAGKDRTGLLLAYYLLTRKGLKAKKAVKELRKYNPNALTANGFEDGFCALADRMVAQHRSGPRKR